LRTIDVLDRVISLHQIFVSGGGPEQKDDIEQLGCRSISGSKLPVQVDALAIALAPFVEDENLLPSTRWECKGRREQIGTVIQGVVDVVSSIEMIAR